MKTGIGWFGNLFSRFVKKLRSRKAHLQEKLEIDGQDVGYHKTCTVSSTKGVVVVSFLGFRASSVISTLWK
jgi:hypothetical protein